MTLWLSAPTLPRRQLVVLLLEQCTAAGLPSPVIGYRDAALSRWTFALARSEHHLLVELATGRHADGRAVRRLTHPPTPN